MRYTNSKQSIVESVVGAVFEEIRVSLIGERSVEIVRQVLPVGNQLWISALHRWSLRGIESPELGALVKVDFTVSSPHCRCVDVVRNAGESLADVLWIAAVHFLANVPPVL